VSTTVTSAYKEPLDTFESRGVILRTERLGRTVSGRGIVQDVSIEVGQGDVLGIVGPSGAGKSSFLRLLNRLDEPTSGTFFLEARDYREITPRELRRKVGMVMQMAFLFPGTVAENIRFGPEQRGEHLEDGRIDELLRQVGLNGFAARAVDHLSGGEAQRVAFARAVANSPNVLLLDEPTSALDDLAKREVETVIRDVVGARHLTCLIVTHDLKSAARLADRILVLEGGKVKRIGPLKEVLDVEANP
jgi:putative ABC transport system ATP-binding protein